MTEHPPPLAPVEALATVPAVETRRLLGLVVATPAYVDSVLRGWPYTGFEALVAASDDAVSGLTWPAVEQALAAHPRIGEQARGSDVEATWSRQEQAGAAGAGDDVAAALHRGNLEYEQRFGHIYLVCATGRTSAQLLAALQQRLGNEPAEERDTVRHELAAIARVRLAKLFP